MTYRVTEEEVKGIILTALTNEEIAPFIGTANTYISAVLGDEGYGGDLLKQIELWLSAHFIAIRDPLIKEETYGDGKVVFHGSSGMGLNATPYGQQVMVLDHHGRLAEAALAKGAMEVRAII